jgi:hypothetical protein
MSTTPRPTPALDEIARRRFWNMTTRNPITACWEYTGTINHDGYGQFQTAGSSWMAHRIAYALHHGAVPEGLVIDHLCRNRKCVRPTHLEAVTSVENVMRGLATKTHCPRGHDLRDQNLIPALKHRGRACRSCDIVGRKARKMNLAGVERERYIKKYGDVKFYNLTGAWPTQELDPNPYRKSATARVFGTQGLPVRKAA